MATTSRSSSSTTTTKGATRTGLVGLFLAAVAMSAAVSVTGAIGTIVGSELIGPRWAAIPNVATIVGTGLGALVLSRLISAGGSQRGLAAGYVVAVLGGASAVVSVATSSVLGLVLGMLLIGLGNAAAQLSRYVAADLAPIGRNGLAIGALVWAGTFGGVGGPLLGPLEDLSTTLSWKPALAPFLLAFVCLLLAVTATVTRRPQAVPRPTPATPTPARPSLLLRRDARPSLAVMITGQVVMVLVMTAAPLRMHMRGDSYSAVGTMLSLHVLGMFGLSPLTGRLADRVGPRSVMWVGLAVLATSAQMSAAATGPLMMATLFGVGLGWNLCFVGGSSALVRSSGGSARSEVEASLAAALVLPAAVVLTRTTSENPEPERPWVGSVHECGPPEGAA
jgi:MFS family permease